MPTSSAVSGDNKRRRALRAVQTINKLSQKREFVFLVAKPKGKREANVEL